jgi:SagB-type dehydrogenase family enzyme
MKEAGKEGSSEQPIGERFQQETKYTPHNLGGHHLDWTRMPERYKNYLDPIRRCELPEPHFAEGANLWDTLRRRRSERNYYADLNLPLEVLSNLLWATQGITAGTSSYQLRTAPSAGGLYPVETYLLVRAVEGLDQGFYHFRPHTFDLEYIRSGDFGSALAEAALGQEMVADAQAVFLWTAVIERSRWKYRQRAYRYLYLDAGHIAQNLYLAGTALDLGVCGVGAFFDDRVNALVGVDGTEETILYMASVGCPAN